MTVAAIMAFLVWAYLSGLIMLFGAFLRVSYFQRKQQQQEAASQKGSEPTTKVAGTAPKGDPFAAKNLALALMTGRRASAML